MIHSWTLDFGLKYQKSNSCKLVSYTNSDWVGCVNDRKSTIDYALSLGFIMGFEKAANYNTFYH